MMLRVLIATARTLRRAAMAALAVVGMSAGAAQAVPAFAEQTGQPCQACHVGGFGPQLTPFGREFKLHGYTQRAGGFTVPISAMAVASYVHSKLDAPSPPADGFATNNNKSIDQISLFLAGGLGSHLGAFIQTTYDDIAKAWTWDNLDVRATTTTQVKGQDVVLGVSLNNSPSVQDAWNTLPAWGYPYTSSALAPSPSASPLLAGGLAQNTLGVTGYAWINSELLLEAGAYGSPSAATLNHLGADPFSPGDINGLAPYARVALQRPVGRGTAEVGVFGMRADIHPGRDRSTGMVDRYTDVGVDASYFMPLASGDTFTLNARYTHEQQALDATCALAESEAACPHNVLNDIRADASYSWRNKVGVTVAAFATSGSSNPTIYASNRTFKPDTSGVTVQLDATPWGGGHSPLGPRFNVRVGVQYTAYATFNGAGANYDNAGANASDNNTLRVFTWIAY